MQKELFYFMDMRNYILNDIPENWINLLPLTYTRPISDLRVGIMTIREKWEHHLQSECSVITEDYLSEKYPLALSEKNILINASVLPDTTIIEQIQKLKEGQLLKSGEDWIAIFTKELESFDTDELGSYELIQLDSDVEQILYPWHIFQKNAMEIKKDFEILTKNKSSEKLNDTNRIIGHHAVFAEKGAEANCAVFNTTDGPIYLGKNSKIMEGCLVQGPFTIGENSQLKLGSKVYPGSSLGPHCKVGGEINNVVFWGYSNKAHDGFLGNSVIGEWCNIGADSNNSNLKNNYEHVKIWNYALKSFKDTGSQFCGLIMGDHSKCGINTMFNTGTVVGVSANIFGAGFPRTLIPSFSWGGPGGITTYRLEKAFRTMELVMKRRNLELTDMDKQIINHIFENTKEYRH
jgi:UDP-N-acetylglucosamine diphosphorylase/glucosamine-1-phosphate N-acetyltransferase